MLKYRRVSSGTLVKDTETPVDMLAGMAGKNRHIVSIATTAADGDFLRLYRDAEQILDVDAKLLTTGAPWLLMDLGLAEGQQCKVAIYPAATVAAVEIVIGYTETG